MTDAYITTKGKMVDGYNYVQTDEFQQGVKDGANTVWDGTKYVAKAGYDTVTNAEFQQTAKDTGAVAWDMTKKGAGVAGDGLKEGVQEYKKTNDMK